LEPFEGGVKLSCTDLEIGVETTIPAMVKRFEPVCLPAKMLLNALTGMEGAVTVRTDPEPKSDKIKLVCGESEHFLIPLPAEEFPTLPEGRAFPVSWPGLAGLLASVNCGLGVDESRAILTGVLVTPQEVVTTDTHRLFVRKHGMDAAVSASLPRKWHNGNKPGDPRVVTDEPENIVIPGRICREICSALGCKADDAIEFGTSDSQVWFKFGDTVMVSRLIEGQFPNFEKVIPVDPTGSFTANPKAMLSALKQVAPVARENSNRTIFAIHDDAIELSASSGVAGEVHAQFAVTSEGWVANNVDEEGDGAFKTALSCRYIMDALHVFKGCERVTMAGTGECNQFAITSDELPGAKVVIMPMGLN
jgi:DNA polymerase-3 subunit beta